MNNRFTVKDAARASRLSYNERSNTLDAPRSGGEVRGSVNNNQRPGVYLNETPGAMVYEVFSQNTIGRNQGTVGRNQATVRSNTFSAHDNRGDDPKEAMIAMYDADADYEEENLVGTFVGTYMPTCSAMWGALIFIRFGIITGQAGLVLALGMTLGSALIVSLTAASVSALSTNGAMAPDGPNGVYFLVTRNLGPSIGGSVSVIYALGVTIMSTVEIIGFTEGITAVIYFESGDSLLPSAYGDQIMFGIIGLLSVAVTLFAGDKIQNWVGLAILGVVLLAYASSFVGLFASSDGWQTGPVYVPRFNETALGMVTGLSSETMSDNLMPDFSEGFVWQTALSYLFPCFLGIFMGANNANGLRTPSSSIPKGAFSAILTSTCLYIMIFCLLAAVAERQLLKDFLLLFCYVAWPTRYLAICGLLTVGIGAAIQLLSTAPKVFASLAEDGVIPILTVLGLQNKRADGFPARATVLCLLIALPFVFATNLDIVATIVTMMFLLSYATVNFTCFLLSVLKSPSWRPGFKYYHPYITALAGTVCCFALMFALNWIAALVSVVLCVLLAFYIEYRVNTEIWGSGLQSMQLHLATKALISMEQQEVVSKYIMMLKLAEARNARARDAVGNIILGSDMDIPAQMLGIVEEDNNSQRRSSIRRTNTMLNQLTGLDNFLARQLHEIPDDFKYNRTKSWVPRFLVLVSMDTADDSLSSFEKTLLSFLYMLAKGSAKDIFIMVGNVLKRDYGLHTQERFLAAMRRKVLLQGAMQDSKINGLAEVVVAKDTEVGANILIQTAGVGSLRPNTIIAGWPRLNTPAKASYVVSLVSLTRASSRACIFLKHGNSFPEPSERVTGTMDLWWVLQEGGMLLLVSFLLTQHKSWKGCKLRLFTVADVTANSVLIEQQLRAFLRELRIKAEVKVIEITTEELNPFTNQMTIARNQSNAAAMRLRGRGGASMFPSCVDQLTGVPMGSSPSSVPSGQQSSSGQRSAYTKITGDTDTAGPLKQSIEGLWKGISIAPPEESKSQGFLLGDDSDDSTLDVDTSISAKRYHSADITDSNNDSRKPQSYLGKTTPGSRYRVSPAEQKRSDATDDKSDTKGERQRLQPNTPQIQTQTRSDIDIPTQAQTQAQAPPHNTHTHTDSKRTEYGKDSLEEIDLKTSERRTQRTDHMASGESDAQVIKDKRKESLRLSMSSEALLVGKDITTEPIAEGIVPHFYDASASTPNSPVRTRANTVTSTDSSHSNTHTHDATENSRKSTASYDNAKGSTSRLRAFSRLRKAAESLAARTSKGFSTNKLAEGEHIPEEGVEVPMRETSRTSQESGKTSSDGKQKKNLFTAPGLKQAMHTESSNARLVIMNLPVPTDESAINPSGYLTLVNELTEGLHNVVLVNGLTDGTDVISVYQS